MADKPELKYTVKQLPNRATGGVLYVPAIVERDETIPLDEIIIRAIDRGLIAGIKPTAAKSIANAIALQMYEELSNGRGVKFGNYFHARIFLDGVSDGNGTLVEGRNHVNVRLYPAKGFKLSLDSFSWTFTQGGNIPSVDWLISDAEGAERNKLQSGEAIKVMGLNLDSERDASKKGTFTEIVEEGETPQVVEVNSFTLVGPDMVTCAWPASLVTGKQYKFVLDRVIGETTYRSNEVSVEVISAE